jgi:Sulfotransferase family
MFEALSSFFKKFNNHVYVYHHIPKCGGSSMQVVLGKIFDLKKNYNIGEDEFVFSELKPGQCVMGHYDSEDIYLTKLYPDIFSSRKYRLISFIRDPLEARLSLFRYENQKRGSGFQSIQEDFSNRKNWLSARFPVTIDNYKEVLDQYWFIGLLERKQESLDFLCNTLGVKTVKMPHKNTTNKDSISVEMLSEKDVEDFKRDNYLDYLVYDYVKQKFPNV